MPKTPAHLILPSDPLDEPLLEHADGSREIVAAMLGDRRVLSIALATLGYLAPDLPEQHPSSLYGRVALTRLPATPCPRWCLEPGALTSHRADADHDGTPYRTHLRIVPATQAAEVTLTRTDRVTPFAPGRAAVSVLGDGLEPVDALRLAAALMDASDLLTLGGAR